jgi:CheY-like chemotaxis protein
MEVAERMKTIPVVEDEDITEEFPRDWLTDAGYQVETAGDGEKLLRDELGSWDEEGRVIAEQIITRFPRLFPYISSTSPPSDKYRL